MIQQRYQGIHGQQCEDGLVQRWGYDICGHFNAEHDYRPDVFFRQTQDAAWIRIAVCYYCL